MRKAYTLFKRNGVYYSQDTQTGKQKSLKTKSAHEAKSLIDAKNQAVSAPHLNRALGLVFLTAADPEAPKRTWNTVMEQYCSRGKDSTKERRKREISYTVYNLIRHKPLVETTADDLFRVLNAGGTATNHTLRSLHNLALGLNWITAPIISAKQWPSIKYGVRRGITAEEHAKIIQNEKNTERRHFYEILWQTGASQTDAAMLTTDNFDSNKTTLTYFRVKTGEMAKLGIGSRFRELLSLLPQSGYLFPNIAKTSANDRSAEFSRRCKLVEVSGVSLHSYRYAWAERAAQDGYPERYAQLALGHNCSAVHRAYAKKAVVTCPPLDEFKNGFQKAA